MAKKTSAKTLPPPTARAAARPATSTASTRAGGAPDVAMQSKAGIPRTVGGATAAEATTERVSGRLTGYYPPSSQSSARPIAPAGMNGTVGIGLDEPLAEVDQRPLGRSRRRATEEQEGLLPGPGIRVRATKVGYYNDKRRRIGDVFELRARRGTFTEVVMDKKTNEPREIRGITMTREVKKVLSAADQFSATWMETVDGDEPLKTTTGREALQQTHDDVNRSRLANRAGRGDDVDIDRVDEEE